ncbi:CHRD domain-containing protein [Bradyrhizobium sp. SZCCHNR3003]|uniref:CHRD domain-containing protein n=1 Tax=Bradyrhizobium TaxID=374 RepID=UPI0029165828|nr:CHRD domain-containing protein [Bradyrhizobium sp. SZCCHNR3003]
MGRTFVHLSLLAVVAGVAAAPLARAETVILKSELKAANEVPPNTSPATGAAEASFDTATRTLSWKVTYSGLTGPAMGAHFHGPSEPGKNAGIVLPFKSPETPITGSAVITDAQAADLLAGKWYANVHTQANPGGEIRGQMTRQ